MKKTRTAKPKPKRGGRGKAESVTGAAENAVEVRKPVGIGDNSKLKLIEPSDFDHHLKNIKGTLEKLETAKSLVRHAMESANKSSKGLGGVIKEIISLERKNDPTELAHYLQTFGIGLKVIGCPIQITIFDTLAGEVADQAYKRGYADGEGGRANDSPYPALSDLDQAYAKGWRHGTAKNLGVSPEESDAAEAERLAEGGGEKDPWPDDTQVQDGEPQKDAA